MNMRDSTKKRQIQIFVHSDEYLDPKTVNVTPGQMSSLLEILNNSKIEIPQSCGGLGTCGTCQVSVIEGLDQLSAREEIEIEMAQDRGFEINRRLSCQTQVFGSCKIKI